MKVTRFERLFLLFSLLSIGFASPRAQPRRVVIAAGHILDGRGRLLPASRIVVEGSKIVAIDATVGPVDYDLSRETVMPGSIDTHIHLNWHFDENHLGGWGLGVVPPRFVVQPCNRSPDPIQA